MLGSTMADEFIRIEEEPIASVIATAFPDEDGDVREGGYRKQGNDEIRGNLFTLQKQLEKVPFLAKIVMGCHVGVKRRASERHLAAKTNSQDGIIGEQNSILSETMVGHDSRRTVVARRCPGLQLNKYAVESQRMPRGCAHVIVNPVRDASVPVLRSPT
jgi:hypothetical protein